MKIIPLQSIISQLKWWINRYPLIADGNEREIELDKYIIRYSAEIHGDVVCGGSDDYGNFENVFVESGRYVEFESIEYDEDGNETPVHIEGCEDYLKNNI
jgi:hypothetical protein